MVYILYCLAGVFVKQKWLFLKLQSIKNVLFARLLVCSFARLLICSFAHLLM